MLFGELPNTFNQEVIIKKGKDPLCPFSLAGMDNKILTKILTVSLEDIMPNFIHPDQVGSVRGRSFSNNLRR